MSTHHFLPDHFHTTMAAHEPVLVVDDGDTIVTTTVDAAGIDLDGHPRVDGSNAQTGPFFVRGAEPGDSLAVRLDRLWPNRESGYANTAIVAHVLQSVDGEASGKRRGDWQIDRQKGTASLVSPHTCLTGVSLPIRPMLGCFGVAPAGGQAISTATSGEHGGNMDYRGFVEGVTVYFPVALPGALLFVGDGHALQGDGEIAGMGIETSFDVQVSVHVRKRYAIGRPRAENEAFIMTVGSAPDLERAMALATAEMHDWLRREYGMDPVGAQVLLGQCVEYDVGNVVDPAFTMVCKIRKDLLSRFQPVTPPLLP